MSGFRISENFRPIAPDGSVPVWDTGDEVRVCASWSGRQDQTGRVAEVYRAEGGSYWIARVVFADGGNLHVVEPELACVRHNERGGSDFGGRWVYRYCSCGEFVRKDPTYGD